MIPIHRRLLRLIPVAASALSALFVSGAAGAQQDFAPAGEAVESAPRVRWSALPSGAVGPEVTRWELIQTGDVYEEFDVIITWSEDVEDFELNDVRVDDGDATKLTGDGRRYTLTIEPDEVEGYVTVTIRAGRVVDAADVENAEQEERFRIDNRRPEFEDAIVDGDVLVITYHEDLVERSAFVPSAVDFVVEVEGDDVEVENVEVEREAVILTLESSVRRGDAVRVTYEHGAAPLQDEAGNLAEELDRERVDNITRRAAGTPGPPRSLTARAGGASVIELDWREPADSGDDEITGYRIEYSRDAGATWRTLEDDTDDTATNYRDTGLSTGTTRHYRVAAINRRGAGAWSDVANATTNRVPGRPTGLTARARGASSIELDWTAPSAAADTVTGYRIEVSLTGTGGWTVLEADTDSRATEYRHTGLGPGTRRHYRVAAINRHGAGAWSNVADATTDQAPGRPTRLTARARDASSIELDWTAPSASVVTGYRIETSSTGTGGWTVLEADTDSRATEYRHTGLGPGTRHYYRVAAINRHGTGAWSSVADATTDTTVPGAPTGLRAMPSGVGGSDQILLTWTAPADAGGSPITGYRIEWSATGAGAWISLNFNTGSTATTYLDTGLPPATTRFYRVSAVNGVGIGRASNVAEGTTNAARPGQPQNVRARGTGPHTVLLAWDPPQTDGGARVTGYSIRVIGPNDESWMVIRPNTGTTATTFTHTGLQPVSRYQYQVAAINRVGTGAWSLTAAILTHADLAGAPTGLAARAVGTARIDLSWTAPRYTGGVSILGYRIEASDDGGATWNIIRRNTNAATTTFSDLNLRPATTRHYRVAAVNLAGVGAWSNTARATTDATLPGVPRRLTAEAAGTSQIGLSWQAPSDDGGARVTGYRIEVSEDGGRSWEDLVANTRTTATVYTHGGLEPASTRHYRVSAINRIGVGDASRVAGSTTDATVPDAPTGLAANDVTPTQIDLAWVAPAYNGGAPITGYRIEVSETGAAWADLVTNTESTVTAFSHTGLQPGSVRHYRVSAINRAGTGAPSASASAATDDPVQRAGRLNTRVLPHVAAAMTSSTVGAIARRVDAVASGMGMQQRVETNGLSSMAASLSQPGPGGLGLARGDGAGLAALFGGTSFTMPFGVPDAQQQSATGTRLASWGGGEYHYLGEPGAGALDWRGNMVSAHVGIDARIGSDLLAGVAGSYNSGSFDFTDKTGARPVKGTYGATMTSVHPYLAWFSGASGASVWGTAGYGWGDVEVDDEREAFRTSPARTMTGAAGGSYQLLTRGMGGVRVKAEGWAGRVMVDGARQIEEVTLEMQRGKLALELTQGFRTDTGHELGFVLEGGMRYDNGDGMNGAGAEVGGGLRYTNARLGVTAEGRGRFVLSSRDGYEEWGLGGTLMFDPAARGEGLSIRVAPSYGDHRSGVNQLWERGVSDAVGGHGLGMGPNVNGEVAYGIAGFRGTPFSGFHLAGSGTRAFSSGVRYDLGAGVGVRLEGTRRESGLGATRHSVGIRGRVRFR